MQNESVNHIIADIGGTNIRIAQVAQAEPDLAYGGIAVVVDALAYDDLCSDPQIGAQIRSQVEVADVVLVSKADADAWPTSLDAAAIDLRDVEDLAPLLTGIRAADVPERHVPHAHYVSWSTDEPGSRTRDALNAMMKGRPTHLLRFKGVVPDGNAGWEVHGVGKNWSVKPMIPDTPFGIVGIGLEGRITADEIAAWWSAEPV
ncbi:MAG: hypothetical protein HRU30_19910 [Rhodobacteraceae bacterium]|nr:hypothetical protein [Paracoccaceae bacterium]